MKKKIGALEMYVHQPGLLFTDEPSAYPMIKINTENNTFVYVEHEISTLLNYDGQRCIKNETYDLQNCRQKSIYKVKLFLLLL